MILREAVYALKTILKENNIDSIIEDEFLINRINTYRGSTIENQNQRFSKFDKNWIQDLGALETSTINSADDPYIKKTSVALSKIEIPQTIELNGLRTLNVRTGSKHRTISEISMDRLFNMIQLKDEMLGNLHTYFRIGQSIYVYPLMRYVSVSGILQNPLEGYTTKELVDQNGLIISPAGTKRNLTIDDQYPMDNNSLTDAMISLLRIDYNIIIRERSDLFPDGINDKDIR